MLDIRMVIPGLPIVAPDPLAVSLGDSETAALQLAAEFVRQGHRVTMVANVETPFTWKGVWLVGELSAEEAAHPCDLFLVQRACELLQYRNRAKIAAFWPHDQPCDASVRDLMEHGHRADRIITLSRSHTEQWRANCPQFANRWLTIRNGVDLDLIAEGAAVPARAAGLGWGPVAEQIIEAATTIPAAPAILSPRQKRVKLVIGTPAYDGRVGCGFTTSLLRTRRLLEQAGIFLEVNFLYGHSLIPRGRDIIAAQFLADPAATHLLFIDSDIEWDAEDVLRMLSHDLDVCCGIYPLKTLDGPCFPFQPLPDPETAPQLPNGCVEIKFGPNGFMMITREAFVRLMEAYPERKIHQPFFDRDASSWLYDFFPVGVFDGEYLSEDYGFCYLWRAIGGHVWADPAVQLRHVGAHTYVGDPRSAFTTASRVGEAA